MVSINGNPVKCIGEAQISPLLQTTAGSCRLRNIKVKIIEDKDDSKRSGTDSAGEIVLGNPLLQAAGLNVKDFFADNIQHIESLDFGTLLQDSPKMKVGKLGSKLQQVLDFEKSTISPNDALRTAQNILSTTLKDIDDINYKEVEVGNQDKNELQDAISFMIGNASGSLSKEFKVSLFNLVMENEDIFRIRLGSDPPVDVPPMTIEFEGDEKPVAVRNRNCSPQQLDFLRKKVEELIQAGFIYRNTKTNWACAPLNVPKPGKDGFRFTVDLRTVNAQTKRNVWPFPNAEVMLTRLTGSKVFFNLDFLHGYWQFPLHEKSQNCQSFHTPFGVYTPNRVQHGATNSVAYFQSSMEMMFGQIDVLIYLDDILGYACDVSGLLDKLRLVFQKCKEKGLKLNPRKCKLVTKEVHFCGRIIDKKGVKFHPRQFETLTNMKPPTTVGALMELVHGANWMRTAIPEYSELIAPLHSLLECNYALNKTRKKTRIANRPISAWGDEHDDAFQSLISAIKNQVTLSTPDLNKRLC